MPLPLGDQTSDNVLKRILGTPDAPTVISIRREKLARRRRQAAPPTEPDTSDEDVWHPNNWTIKER